MRVKFATVIALLLLLGGPARGQEYRAEELRVLQLTNENRARVGLPPLVEVPGLTRVARDWASEQLEDGLMGHESRRPGRRWPIDRVKAAGVPVSGISENVASVGAEETDLGGFLVALWMASPHHRSSILDARSRGIGIGIEKRGQEYRAVQVFCYYLPGEKPPAGTSIRENRAGNTPSPKLERGSLKLTPAQRKKADKLAGQPQWPISVTTDAANAPLWFYLSHHSDPLVVSRALDALDHIYTGNPDFRAKAHGQVHAMILVDPEFKQLALRCLKSKNAAVAGSAMRLTQKLLWGDHPDREAAQALEDVYRTRTEKELRRQAVGSFWLCRVPDPVRDRVLIGALKDADSGVWQRALFVLGDCQLTAEYRNRILNRCIELTGARSADIRCWAADALRGPSFQGKGNAGKALHALLADPDPAVRARALYNLGKAQRTASIAGIVSLVDDPSSSIHRREDGTTTGGGDLGTIGDVALRALHDCTRDLKSSFVYQLYDIHGTPNAAQKAIMRQEATRARKWYETVAEPPPQD